MKDIFLESLLDNFPGYVYWKDKNSRYKMCNANLAKVLKLTSREQIIGMSDHDFPWADQFAIQFIEEDQYVMQTGKTHVSEHTFPVESQNSQFLVMRTEKNPFYNTKGEIIGILAVAIEITAQREAEKKEKEAIQKYLYAHRQTCAENELRQAITILAGSSSHGIKTLASSVGVISTTLQQYMPKLISFYKRAYSKEENLYEISESKLISLNEIPKLLNNIFQKIIKINLNNLDIISSYNRQENSEKKFVLCSVEECISETINYYPFKENEKNLINWNRGYNFDFLGDKISFFKMLTNLINNSLSQIQQHGIGKINIYTKENDKYNILIVNDPAEEISKETKSTLCTLETSMDSRDNRLSFCKNIMCYLGGDIKCEFIEGVGTEFELLFPKN